MLNYDYNTLQTHVQATRYLESKKMCIFTNFRLDFRFSAERTGVAPYTSPDFYVFFFLFFIQNYCVHHI